METFFDGIAPEHAPALVAGLVTLVVLAFVRSQVSIVDRWAGALLGYAAAAHLFLLLGGHGNALAYLACGLAFAALAFLAFTGRRWRLGTAILAPATVIGYLIWGGSPDQVGILTALIELTAFGLAVTQRRRVLGAIGTITAVFAAGAVMWIGAFTAHDHHGDDMVRAQAGVIMRALGQDRADAEQTAAAIGLVQATTAATAKFARLHDALAAGYRYPIGKKEGMDVHLEHPEYKKDGRLL